MDYALIFKIANLAVLPAWALLMFLPRHRITYIIVYSHAYPYFLGLLYAWLIFSNFGTVEGGMSSLAAIRNAFNSDAILLAGWLHYLIFDLFVGAWQVQDARENHIGHLKIIPTLAFTLFLGPIGLLAYLILRQVSRRA